MARLRDRARPDVRWPDLPSAHRASAHLLHCMACINGAGLRICGALVSCGSCWRHVKSDSWPSHGSDYSIQAEGPTSL